MNAGERTGSVGRTATRDDGAGLALLPEATLERVASMLKAVAHPVRLRILELLELHGEMSVGEIVESLGAKPAITSQQLGLMKDRGVLESRREGNRVFYRVKDPAILRIVACVREHCCREGGE